MINTARLKSCIIMSIDEIVLNPFEALTFDKSLPGIVVGENYNIVPSDEIDLDTVDINLVVAKNDYITIKVKNNTGDTQVIPDMTYNVYKN